MLDWWTLIYLHNNKLVTYHSWLASRLSGKVRCQFLCHGISILIYPNLLYAMSVASVCVHLFACTFLDLFACTYLRAPICVHLFACTYLDLFALICVHPIVPICTYLRAPISRMEAAAWLVVTSVLVEMNMSRTRCTNTHIHTRMHT